ncbi:MAG TPA: HAD family hydrolase, partial [Candidatus Limnocylindria bacterium]|nr:HAD family hydrolase [Candidatus Limnocylindria bacterium]
MPVRAVFFDVGDTLVQHWKPQEEVRVLVREALRRELGDREWYDRFVESEIVPETIEEEHRQETNRWYQEWFRNSQIGIDDIDIDRLRSVVTVPLDLVGSLVPGTTEALTWAKARGLTVGLITNTLSRGDREVRRDWERFGLADRIDVIASSHSVGWYKPHEEIFRRALRDAGVIAADAVMVGDRLREDVWGAKRLGMRAIWRRPLGGPPQA